MPTESAELPQTREIVQHVFGPVKEYSRLAGQIPSEDYEYHMAFPRFKRVVREHGESLIHLMDTCCQLLPTRRRVSLTPQGISGSCLVGISESQRTAVMEAVDSLLESVDSVLDEVRGRKLRAQEQLSVTFGLKPTMGSPLSTDGMTATDTGSGMVRVAHVMRPQLIFDTPVDNALSPFVPIYYDALGTKHIGTAHVHPFEEEIRAFKLPEDQLVPKPEIPSLPLETCPLRFVDTPQELQEVVVGLMKTTELAVDLEHHDFYSYQGITCLMQISTRAEDIIIDCLKLRSSMHLLAPVFLNGNILKVFHGAREDIRWLQKDFGLYVINFFDTGVALQTLHMPHGLAFAVDHFCQVRLNKKYQTADWRIRPMPAEMVNYARQDTHFLLYIYDRLKALLLNSEGRAAVGNLLVHVYNESRRLSLDRYEKPELDPDRTYKLVLGRSLGGLTAVQERVAKVVFNWRDAAAREVDDSPSAVLHLSSVLAIASKLPTSATDLLRCCSPVSVILRKNVSLLVGLVRTAVEEDTGATTQPGVPLGLLHPCGTSSVPPGGMDDSARARPVGFHRPMTGTLPSIAYWIDAALPPSLPEDAKTLLKDDGPSSWFTAMHRLSLSMASKPRLHVPLPGHDVLQTLWTSVAQPKQETAAVSAAFHAESSLPPPSPEDEGAECKNTTREGCKVEEEAELVVRRVPVEERAVAMRQAYGTGASNRKKSKKSAPKSSKK